MLNLSEKIDSSYDVAWTVARNFDKLPEDVRNKLLIRLLGKSSPVRNEIYSPFFKKIKVSTLDVVSRVVANNFDKLPENVRNELLLKLSEKENAPLYVAWTIANNFDKLPEDIRKLLFTFLERIQSAKKWKESWVLDRDTSKTWTIEEFEARARAEEARAVAWAVENNFDKLPENVRIELLHRLSNIEETSEYLARTIVNNFVKIPEKIRNDILLLLSRNHDTAKDVQDAFKFSYYKLPIDVRNILNLNLGLGGIVFDDFESKDKSLNFLKRIKLLELLNHNWDYNPNEIKFADMKDNLHG